MIEGLSIDGLDTHSCIDIENTRSYFVVRNCCLYNAAHTNHGGIRLVNATNGLIENNRAITDFPIRLWQSHDNRVQSNNLAGSDGVEFQESHENIITENYCRAGGSGNAIHLSGSDNNTVTNNDCHSAGDFKAICIWASEYTTLANNTCYGDTRDGVGITNSKHVTLTSNTITTDKIYVVVKSSSDIRVMWNALISNYWYPAHDESGENFFDYNYYSDYTGTDEDHDGIGDTPYISLHDNIRDNHLLMYPPGSEPIVSPPTEFPFQLVAVLGIGIVVVLVVVLRKKR